MTSANRITLTRICLVPVFMVFLAISAPWSHWACAIIFIIAALTDGVDGYVARKYNQVTTFGKFIDPLADKLLVAAALIGFVELGKLEGWIAVVILAREFIVTSLRLVAVSEGTVIAASNWAKAKTASQITAIISLLFDRIYLLEFSGVYLSAVLVWVALILTVFSGYMYIKENWKLLEFK